MVHVCGVEIEDKPKIEPIEQILLWIKELRNNAFEKPEAFDILEDLIVKEL